MCTLSTQIDFQAAPEKKFTKLVKPLLSGFHLKGHIVPGYIDDFYLQNDDAILMFDKFGCVVHPESLFSLQSNTLSDVNIAQRIIGLY